MTLDDIRKLSTGERAALSPGVTGTVLSFCDAVDALIAVVERLPSCEAVAGCGRATREYDPPGQRQLLCDEHEPTDDLFTKYPYRAKYLNDLPYAAALRALLAKESQR